MSEQDPSKHDEEAELRFQETRSDPADVDESDVDFHIEIGNDVDFEDGDEDDHFPEPDPDIEYTVGPGDPIEGS